jgi:hypothetical protein
MYKKGRYWNVSDRSGLLDYIRSGVIGMHETRMALNGCIKRVALLGFIRQEWR